MSKLQIFLATPITPLLTESGEFRATAKERLSHILSSLRNEFEVNVFCAIEREKWGAELMAGDVCTALDLQGLEESDIIVAFPHESFGVHVELGWASVLKKPVVILQHSDVGLRSPLIEGLHTLTQTRYITFTTDKSEVFPSPEQWSEELLALLTTSMHSMQFLYEPSNNGASLRQDEPPRYHRDKKECIQC